jgi:hypothetical protein
MLFRGPTFGKTGGKPLFSTETSCCVIESVWVILIIAMSYRFGKTLQQMENSGYHRTLL